MYKDYDINVDLGDRILYSGPLSRQLVPVGNPLKPRSLNTDLPVGGIAGVFTYLW